MSIIIMLGPYTSTRESGQALVAIREQAYVRLDILEDVEPTRLATEMRVNCDKHTSIQFCFVPSALWIRRYRM